MSSLLASRVAIDMPTHATVSTRNPPDEVAIAMDAAMHACFKQPTAWPTIDGHRNGEVVRIGHALRLASR